MALGGSRRAVPPGAVRSCPIRHRQYGQGSTSTAFANEAALLAVSQASVDALNTTLHASGEAPVDARHFRPNFVIEDADAELCELQHAGAEADVASSSTTLQVAWRSLGLASGQIRLDVIGPCARCAMVEIDPSSGARHGAVQRALARHHRVRSRLIFGVFCAAAPSPPQSSPQASLIELRTGSLVTIESS